MRRSRNIHGHFARVETLLLGLFFVVAMPGRAQNQNAANPAVNVPAANGRVARLARAEGDVGITGNGSTAREPGVANMPLQQGDLLSTAAGMAEVEFDDGATAFLNQNAQLELTQLARSATGTQTELTLKQGVATFSGTFNAADTFTVSTITFQISVPQNAEFRANTLGADGASVEVISGSITVSTKAGSITLSRGQSVAVHQSDLNQPQIVGMLGPDNFDAWVASLVGVQVLGRNGEMRFWSPPVYYGYSDLATFGTWMDFEGFGTVWRPYASAPNSDWHPYQNGGWTFRPDVGWIWISYEPWGWLPYHYGSWHYAPGGWLWVPGAAAGFRQWQPARVRWVRNGGQVGWVAISPHDAPDTARNLEHGMVTRGAAAEGNRGAPNEVRALDAKQVRGIARLAAPPSTFAVSALPPAPKLATPTIAEFARGMSSIVYDPRTRTFASGSGLYVPQPKVPSAVGFDSRLRPNARVNPIPGLAHPEAPVARQVVPPVRLPAHSGGGSTPRVSAPAAAPSNRGVGRATVAGTPARPAVAPAHR